MAETQFEELNIEAERIVSQTRGMAPSERVRKAFLKHIHEANRLLKQELERRILQRLDQGLDGAIYSTSYAQKKAAITGQNVNPSGPVDLELSGQLKNNLEGRGRARTARQSLRAWINWRKQERRPVRRAPGAEPTPYDSSMTNRRLAGILSGEEGLRYAKLDAEWNPPFFLDKSAREDVVRRTAQKLFQDLSANS